MRDTYHPPLKSECLNNLFHSGNELMTGSINLQATLDTWSLETIEDKDW